MVIMTNMMRMRYSSIVIKCSLSLLIHIWMEINKLLVFT